MKEFVDAVNRINNNAEIVVYTVAEHIPQIQMRMKNMFNKMTLFKCLKHIIYYS